MGFMINNRILIFTYTWSHSNWVIICWLSICVHQTRYFDDLSNYCNNRTASYFELKISKLHSDTYWVVDIKLRHLAILSTIATANQGRKWNEESIIANHLLKICHLGSQTAMRRKKILQDRRNITMSYYLFITANIVFLLRYSASSINNMRQIPMITLPSRVLAWWSVNILLFTFNILGVAECKWIALLKLINNRFHVHLLSPFRQPSQQWGAKGHSKFTGYLWSMQTLLILFLNLSLCLYWHMRV